MNRELKIKEQVIKFKANLFIAKIREKINERKQLQQQRYNTSSNTRT